MLEAHLAIAALGSQTTMDGHGHVLWSGKLSQLSVGGKNWSQWNNGYKIRGSDSKLLVWLEWEQSGEGTLIIEAIRLGNRCLVHRFKLQLKTSFWCMYRNESDEGKESGRDTSSWAIAVISWAMIMVGVSIKTRENEISSKEVAEDSKYFKVCF